ncbi:MAG: hypothetical protein JNM28_08400 [Armatimonadetes bacterium]|nr:hypothetical protein [Armatimonadota bacterium]
MKKVKLKTAALAIIATLAYNPALAQELTSAEKYERLQLASHEESLMYLLLSDKKYQEVISHKDAALRYYKESTWFPSTTFYYYLGTAYEGLGMDAHAARAYKWALRGDSFYGMGGGGSTFQFYPQYIRLLLRQNRLQDAQDVYTVFLDTLSTRVNSMRKSPHGYDADPFPILVLFHDDPKADVWAFTPNRLEAAVTMLEAMEGDWDAQLAAANKAHALFPEWYVPVAYQAFYVDYFNDLKCDEALYAQAVALARTDEERTWLSTFHLYHSKPRYLAREDPNFPELVDSYKRRAQIAYLGRRSLDLAALTPSSIAIRNGGPYREIDDDPLGG